MRRRQTSLLIFILNFTISQMLVLVRRIPMTEKHFVNKTDEMIENFIEECEREAAKLEVTVDYYLAEFI
tara:strand:- start:251 stop:457 length:207 start_codon:yes stop_codon:yes gene_type:complete